MKHPNEYWLKYMLMFSDLSLEQICEAAVLYEMPEPDTDYLLVIREQLERTKPSPFRLDFAETRKWVRRQRFMSLAKEDKYPVQARDLLGNTKVRPVLEALLIADTPLDSVALYIKDITGQAVTKRVIKMYSHYFWNRELLSTSQWFDYLRHHDNGRLLKSCYSRGEAFALWKLGHKVELSQKEVIRDLFHESSMRFFETAEMPNGKETAMTAKLWAENIFKATEELNKTGDAVSQVIDGLRDIAIKLGKRDISSVQDLGDIGEGEEDVS